MRRRRPECAARCAAAKNALKAGPPRRFPLDYEGMAEFLRHTMKMTAVYQPILVRTLIESGGEATDRDVARAFLGEDKRQLDYYVRIARRWPRQVLEDHGVVTYRRGAKGRPGVFALPVRYPTVARGAARIRVSVTAHLSAADIDLAVGAFGRAGRRLGLL